MLSSNATVSGKQRDFSRGRWPYRYGIALALRRYVLRTWVPRRRALERAFGSAPFATMNLMVSLSPT